MTRPAMTREEWERLAHECGEILAACKRGKISEDESLPLRMPQSEVRAYETACRTMAALQDAGTVEELIADAKRWRTVRDSVWFGTTEDGEVCFGMSGELPEDCAWLTDAERETLTNDAPKKSEWSDLTTRFVDALRTLAAGGHDGE